MQPVLNELEIHFVLNVSTRILALYVTRSKTVVRKHMSFLNSELAKYGLIPGF